MDVDGSGATTCDDTHYATTIVPTGEVRDDGLAFWPWALSSLLAGALFHILLETISRTQQTLGWSLPTPPYTIVIFAAGIAAALLNDGQFAWTGEVGASLQVWSETHPHIVLFILMPPIIFEEAFKVLIGPIPSV